MGMSLARFVAFGSGRTELVLQGSWGEQCLACAGDPKVPQGEASTRRSGAAQLARRVDGLVRDAPT